jgi:hypothetical protein
MSLAIELLQLLLGSDQPYTHLYMHLVRVEMLICKQGPCDYRDSHSYAKRGMRSKLHGIDYWRKCCMESICALELS